MGIISAESPGGQGISGVANASSGIPQKNTAGSAAGIVSVAGVATPVADPQATGRIGSVHRVATGDQVLYEVELSVKGACPDKVTIPDQGEMGELLEDLGGASLNRLPVFPAATAAAKAMRKALRKAIDDSHIMRDGILPACNWARFDAIRSDIEQKIAVKLDELRDAHQEAEIIFQDSVDQVLQAMVQKNPHTLSWECSEIQELRDKVMGQFPSLSDLHGFQLETKKLEPVKGLGEIIAEDPAIAAERKQIDERRSAALFEELPSQISIAYDALVSKPGGVLHIAKQLAKYGRATSKAQKSKLDAAMACLNTSVAVWRGTPDSENSTPFGLEALELMHETSKRLIASLEEVEGEKGKARRDRRELLLQAAVEDLRAFDKYTGLPQVPGRDRLDKYLDPRASIIEALTDAQGELEILNQKLAEDPDNTDIQEAVEAAKAEHEALSAQLEAISAVLRTLPAGPNPAAQETLTHPEQGQEVEEVEEDLLSDAPEGIIELSTEGASSAPEDVSEPSVQVPF